MTDEAQQRAERERFEAEQSVRAREERDRAIADREREERDRIERARAGADKPLREGNNPHDIWTDEWFAWKEEHFDYVPYHVGKTPAGGDCPTMPRVVKDGAVWLLADGGWIKMFGVQRFEQFAAHGPTNAHGSRYHAYRCPDCGKRFYTSRATLAAKADGVTLPALEHAMPARWPRHSSAFFRLARQELYPNPQAGVVVMVGSSVDEAREAARALGRKTYEAERVVLVAGEEPAISWSMEKIVFDEPIWDDATINPPSGRPNRAARRGHKPPTPSRWPR